jgi:hypothetical protein
LLRADVLITATVANDVLAQTTLPEFVEAYEGLALQKLRRYCFAPTQDVTANVLNVFSDWKDSAITRWQ